MKNTARFISFIFHPMLLTTYAVILIFMLPTFLSLYPYNYKKAVVLIIFTATFISPLLVMLILLNLRKIKSLHLVDRKERIFPFVISLVLYISAYIITLRFPGGTPFFISSFVLLTTVLMFILLLITFKFKVSVHMAGIGGFIGWFYIFFLRLNLPEVLYVFNGFHFLTVYFFAALFIVAGLVASSRLLLKAHNPIQIISGFLIGLTVGLLDGFLF